MNPKADDYKSILQLDKGYLKYKPVQDTCVSICLISVVRHGQVLAQRWKNFMWSKGSIEKITNN